MPIVIDIMRDIVVGVGVEIAMRIFHAIGF